MGSMKHFSSLFFFFFTDFPTELGYLLPVTYGASAGLTSLILMSIFICYRRKSRAGKSVQLFLCCISCCVVSVFKGILFLFLSTTAFPVDFCCRGSDARVSQLVMKDDDESISMYLQCSNQNTFLTPDCRRKRRFQWSIHQLSLGDLQRSIL